jgi:hypothetical protein
MEIPGGSCRRSDLFLETLRTICDTFVSSGGSFKKKVEVCFYGVSMEFLWSLWSFFGCFEGAGRSWSSCSLLSQVL